MLDVLLGIAMSLGVSVILSIVGDNLLFSVSSRKERKVLVLFPYDELNGAIYIFSATSEFGPEFARKSKGFLWLVFSEK